MISRRDFIATAAAATALGGTPAVSQEFQIWPRYRPQMVQLRASYEVGRILVTPRSHFLYHVVEPGMAMRYGVGVGRAGLSFQGEAVIAVKKEWPTWRPTDEMIAREPRQYAEFRDRPDYAMPGGPSNPLGARALYLFQNGRDTFYRIHGTNAPRTVGQSVSNGCIRMLNEHAVHLYEQVPVGTRVTVF